MKKINQNKHRIAEYYSTNESIKMKECIIPCIYTKHIVILVKKIVFSIELIYYDSSFFQKYWAVMENFAPCFIIDLKSAHKIQFFKSRS
jgi:hypothetical protein